MKGTTHANMKTKKIGGAVKGSSRPNLTGGKKLKPSSRANVRMTSKRR